MAINWKRLIHIAELKKSKTKYFHITFNDLQPLDLINSALGRKL